MGTKIFVNLPVKNLNKSAARNNCVPCSNPSAWERGTFLVGQMCRHMHQAGLIKQRVFGEDTISGRAAQGLPHLPGCDSAVQPVRIENRGDSIPNPYSRYAVSRGGNDTHAVR